MLTYAASGISVGASIALLGLGLTITFITTRTVNFAIGGMGAFGAFVLAEATQHGLPYGVGLAGGIATGALLGLALGAAMSRWFDNADSTTRSVVTIAALISMTSVATLMFGGDPQAVPSRFLAKAFTLFGAPVAQLTVIILVINLALVLGMGAVLTRTVLGKRLRAVSERPQTAELLGIPARRYALAIWALTGAFAPIAVILIASTQSTDFTSLALLVVPALAAALAGLFRSVTWTLIGGLVLGVLQGMAVGIDKIASYRGTIPFLALLLVLLYTQRNERWEDAR